jgi:glycosyltransferase involved in cell wall biosynthesis
LRRPSNRFERMFLTTWHVLMKALNEKADVYHFHDPELIPIALLLKTVGKKAIYDVHEDYGKAILSKYYLPRHTRKSIAWLSNLMEKSAAKCFDAIITATDDILKNFSRHKRAVAVHNFAILSRFANKDSRAQTDKGFNVIYVGGLTQERGISEIVQAMEYLDSSTNPKLVLYGKFSPESYEEKVRKSKGFDRVEYQGWVKPEDVYIKMPQATVGIACFHPEESHINAMPNKLFEYMAAGLPVIASNFPLWKEIVEGNNCGLTVNPLNPREIARALEYLIEHPDETRKMSENGRRAVVEQYNWETESKKLLALYDDLMEVRQPKR